VTTTNVSVDRGTDGRRGPLTWWRDPWRKPRGLLLITLLYVAWSLAPVLIAVMFSFNAG